MASNTPLPQPPSISIEDKLKEFNDVPLFMQSLDDAVDHTAVDALQSLIYEGTPEGM